MMPFITQQDHLELELRRTLWDLKRARRNGDVLTAELAEAAINDLLDQLKEAVERCSRCSTT